MADNLSRALAYLDKLPSAISGSGGHNSTLRAACECVRFGLSEDEAWEAMSWFNQNRCSPVWGEKELRHKIADAQKIVGAGGQRAALKTGHKRRTFTPPVMTARKPARIAPVVHVIHRSHSEEESWWAGAAADLGMSLAEFDAFCGVTS